LRKPLPAVGSSDPLPRGGSHHDMRVFPPAGRSEHNHGMCERRGDAPVVVVASEGYGKALLS